jgi:hypothetical protein
VERQDREADWMAAISKGFYVTLPEPDSTKPHGFVERRWRVSRGRLAQNRSEKNYGVCSYRKRAIVIHTPLSDEDYWATLWHEIMHVTCPDLDETAVLRIEMGLLSACIRAGLFKEDA